MNPPNQQSDRLHVLNFIMFLILGFSMSSCSLIQRSQQARTTNKEIKNTEPRTSVNQTPRVQVTRSVVDSSGQPIQATTAKGQNVQEIGIVATVDARRSQVNQLERRLESENEKMQYARILPLFKDDTEKIEFLTLPTVVSRQEWINENKILKRSKTVTKEMKKAIENQDITMDMSMDLVRKSWGEPNSIEVSGNPLYKNEKWKYIKFVTTSGGYKAEKRIVYFENGKVSGWETE